MAEKVETSKDGGELRRQAEARLHGPSSVVPNNPEEIQHVLHDLQVHQIELELQNEELRRTQYELDAVRARYFDLYDLAPVAYCTLDEKGQILEANLTASLLVGSARCDLEKKFLSRFICKQDQDLYYRHRTQLMDSGETKTFELRMVKSDGSSFWAHLTATLAQDAEGMPLCRVVLNNISGLKQAENELRKANLELEAANSQATALAVRAERANASKSEFLAHMSHEIRTPLNGVLGMAELLAGSNLTPEQRDWASTICRSGESLLALLNDILDFSKIEAGQLTLESVPFDLEQLVFDVAELFRTKLEGRPIEMLVDFDPMLPRRIIGDPGRLRQILNNLISNAIKFTEAGHILVEVKPVAAAGGPLTYGFAVTDTGIGIAPVKQAQLFQPFVQADASTARKYGGTGLGLILVKRIVEAMEGSLDLESQEGTGTRLRFELPLQADSASVPAPRGGTDLSGKRVLVIDDLAINRMLQRRQLVAHGATVGCASSGAEALRQIDEALGRGEPFDAALVDLHMPPGMDGATFGRMVRSDPRCRPMAMVVLTATGVQGEAARLAEIGFDGYLFKPISEDTLAQALAAAIQRATEPAGRALVTRYTVADGRRDPGSNLTIQARILLVEDQEVNQAIARKFLELSGGIVEVAGNGRIAMDLLATASFDLILMDCQMPVMDGYETTRKIRASESGTSRHTPIIAMTAHAMAEDRERCLAAGMDDYLTKPISREALLRGVMKWLPEQARSVESGGPLAGKSGLPVAAPGLELDEDMFLKLWEVFNRNGQEMEQVVIGPFIKRGGELLHAFRQCQATGHFDGIRTAAHSLKGSSRTLGLNALGRIAERLEQENFSTPGETMAGLIEGAERAFAEACMFLREVARG